MMYWHGEIGLQPITFTGSQEEVSEWAHNLIGQEIKVTGKDGKEYIVGLVTSYFTRSIK